ncbi:MAG: hypothetical protein AAGH90_11765 [Pseudomonadota bacterium]
MTRDALMDKAIPAALKLAASTKWADLTLKTLADELGLKLSDFHGLTDKSDLSWAVEGYFDKAMSEGAFDEDESPRTRLFDVLMMRFEAMEDTRDGTKSYLKWRDSNLAGLKTRVSGRAATARWALTCCGLDGRGRVPLSLQIGGLSWAIASAERAWKQETSPDLTRTMAALDAELLKLEARAKWFEGRSTSKKKNDDSGERQNDQTEEDA